MEDDEADEEAYLQAIETALATTRAGQKRTVKSEVVDNALQARDAKKAKSGDRGGRNGSSGR